MRTVRDFQVDKTVHLMFDLRMIQIESNSVIGVCGILREVRTGNEDMFCFPLSRAITAHDTLRVSGGLREALLNCVSETLYQFLLERGERDGEL